MRSFLQFVVELIKTVGGSGEFFCVAAESEMFVYAFTYEIRKIFEVHGRQVFSFVLRAHGAKGPVEVFQLCKAACFRKKIPLADPVRKGWIMALQEMDHVVDGGDIIFLQRDDACNIFRECLWILLLI